MAYSPAQLLMSRNLRDGLPVTEEVLRPKVAELAHQGLLKHQQKYKEYHKGTRELPKLESGDPVHVRFGKTWTLGVVTTKHARCSDHKASCLVMTENGKHYRRNHKFLNKSRDTPLILSDVFEQNVTHVKEPDDEQLESALDQTEEN